MSSTIFGTDGIRAQVGAFPLTLEHLPKLGYAIGTWIITTYGKNARVVLGSDTRISTSFIKHGLTTGMLLHPVYIDDVGIISTPGICVIAQEHLYDCALVVSASHNLFQDNGIKIIDPKKGKLPHCDESIINSLFYTQDLSHIAYTKLGNMSMRTDLIDTYQKYIQSFFSTLATSIRVVIDCAHGATTTVASSIYEMLCIDAIIINNNPTGYNINKDCGSLHPQYLINAVKTHNADFGFAFDGDGDRVIACTREEIILDGDDMLAILMQHPLYAPMPTIVGTVMSNCGFEHYIASKKCSFIRTAVGDKAVSDMLEKNHLLLGGEPSGHIIMQDFLYTGDGIATSLRILETLALLDNTMSIPLFAKFPQHTINMHVSQRVDLTQTEIALIIQEVAASIVPGRLLVRYSGTEPVLRITTEHQDNGFAVAIGQKLATLLHPLLM